MIGPETNLLVRCIVQDIAVWAALRESEVGTADFVDYLSPNVIAPPDALRSTRSTEGLPKTGISP